jgi:hypothetical protein
VITERLTEVLQIRCTVQESENLRRVAEAAGTSVSAAGRLLLVMAMARHGEIADFIVGTADE